MAAWRWLTVAGISLVLAGLSLVEAQRSCDQRSCYPATGDLLVGRESRLYASSTCGLRRPTKYCIVGFLQNTEKCFYCDSRPFVDSRPDGYAFSHLPKYMVSQSPDNRLKTWWQAENGIENVFVQLDLEAEFHFTHLIMTFKTFRPAGMIVEKSADFGNTWKAYRYFSSDCRSIFPGVKMGPQQKIDDVICEQRYSSVEPSTQGEVVMKVLDPLIPVENPYSLQVQNLLKLTNLRITFTKLHSLGDDLLDTGSNVQQKYYYALYEMVIRGSCSCYGHADKCIPVPGAPNDPNMVHGQCNCTHHTTGRNCEKCLDGYWDQPWRPALGNQTNACQKCNCHDHADRCHFDVAVYAATGNKSGGVCDDCQHNTTGRQCEECIALFYKDPSKDISDPAACLPCNCDPAGSVGGGECEAVTDQFRGTVAGRCICKKNVQGERCDQCKDGHWNLLESDADGCQSCKCDSRGTVGNNLCDSITGQCTCKRFVQGTKCNQCYDGFYGVGSSIDGCKTCDCDPGGSYSSTCDKITGSCRCKPNIVGRRCDQVRPGYFFALPDQDTFEAEDAVPSKGTFKKVGGTPLAIGSQSPSWTGDGYAVISPGSVIDFTMVTVPFSGEYDVYLRYKSKDVINWDNVLATITRTDGRDLRGGPCTEAFLAKTLSAYLPAADDAAKFQPTACMQKDLVYNLRLQLPPSIGSLNNKGLHVDSIFVVPRQSAVGLFNIRGAERLRDIYVSNDCGSYYASLTSLRRQNVPPACLEALFSISASAHNGALECLCDPVGTKADGGGSDVLVCQSAGGQCPCKPNVIKRRCSACAPAAYGFGSDGCKLCGCDVVGSIESACDATTGQCTCDGLVEGLRCDRCPPAYFGFPSCEPCDCSNHSSTCDLKTGVCLNCRDNTAGPGCGRCAPGYYGDASKGLPTDCQRCQCPGGSSNNQFSKTCSLQNVNGLHQVACDACQPGYTGQFCERCSDGYYGNPLIQGGSCQPCNCSGNIDMSAIGKCDGVTGECFNCLHNTEGFNCEKCKPWTYGEANNQPCQDCICNKNGTNYAGGNVCNPLTGQCPCLSNVVGLSCNRCLPGHWNLAGGMGCQACNCTTQGSLKDQCQQSDGQCHCRAGFGGRDCSGCEDLHWGQPDLSCSACLCNPAGSESLQCDRKTGKCPCKPGIIGRFCNMCDARTTGLMPRCEQCHPCYDQWDDSITAVADNVTAFTLTPGQLGGNLTIVNITGLTIYDLQVKSLLTRLDILASSFNQTVTPPQVNALRNHTVSFNEDLNATMNEWANLVDSLGNVTARNAELSKEINGLQGKFQGLDRKFKDLVANLTDAAEINLDGSLNITRASLHRSRKAHGTVEDAVAILQSSRKQRSAIIDGHYSNTSSLPQLNKTNTATLAGVSSNISRLESMLDELNRLLCGQLSEECGSCNASSCESCGAGSNCTGVGTLASVALSKALKAKLAVEKKEDIVRGTLDQLNLLDVDVQATLNSAQEAVASAADAQQRNKEAVHNITMLINDIHAFLNGSFILPSEVRVNRTLAIGISLTPEEIKDLANRIRITVANLTDVPAILNASKSDLQLATDLQKEANKTMLMAEKVMNDTNVVLGLLNETSTLLHNGRQMRAMAQDDLATAKAVVDEVTMRNSDVEKLLRAALRDVTVMENTTVPGLALSFQDNRVHLGQAKADAAAAAALLLEAQKTSDDVVSTIESVQKTILDKNNDTATGRQRATVLAGKTKELYENAIAKLMELEALQLRYGRIEEREKDVSAELMKLDARISIVVEKLRTITECYTTCNPQSATFCPTLNS